MSSTAARSDFRNLKAIRSCLLLLGLVSAALAATPQEPASPNAQPRAKAVIKYIQSLQGRMDQRMLPGQFADFGHARTCSS